jgi:tripartite-type tricarboxylate transporter receptor subunit TctC
MLVAAALLAFVADARADDYFKGKAIHIIVGTPPGGGYDTYARLVARHLGDFVAGKPTIIVSNMPGASGSTAATYL